MMSLTYDTYLDKVWGGWTGKCIGGTVGWFEGIKEITHFAIQDLLPDKMVPNDDLDVQLIWIDALMRDGVYLTSRQLMQAWLDQYDCNFGEYGYARRNARRGIYPPESGRYANSFYVTGMGCPIRAEIWGMICPGDPDAAAAYAYRDGVLDHEGESVWSEQFIAAMVAEAFFDQDLANLIKRNSRFLPASSRSGQCVQAAFDLIANGLSWQDAWEELRVAWSHPDCTYTPLNMGILTLALLCGKGDLDDTLSITANAGWDVDCTCSTAAALLGLIAGHDALPERWIRSVGEQVDTLARVSHDMSTIEKIARLTGCICETVQCEAIAAATVTGFPDQAAAPAVRPDKDICLADVDYPSGPVVCAGKTVSINLTIKGDDSDHHQVHLNVNGPAGWQICHPTEINLQAGQSSLVPVQITVPDRVRHMADTNFLNVSLAYAGFPNVPITDLDHLLANDHFGVCGGCIAYITAPVWDSYMDWLAGQELPDRRYLRTPLQTVILPELGEEWGNHRVNIEKPYRPETFSTLEETIHTLGKLRQVGIVADQYVLSDHFGMQGPACCYFLQIFDSPVSRLTHAFLGSDCSFKLWINGAVFWTQSDHRMWFPNNNVVEVELKKGVNYLVLKVARTGLDNRTTLAFREKPVLPGYDSSPFIIDLTTLALEE